MREIEIGAASALSVDAQRPSRRRCTYKYKTQTQTSNFVSVSSSEGEGQRELQINEGFIACSLFFGK